MSKHFTQAMSLVDSTSESLAEIEVLYSTDLRKSAISDKLLIKMKSFLESLRSALEYSAQGIAEKYGTQRDKTKISFPFAKLSVTKDEFIRRRYIENRIPGLAKNRPAIAEYVTAMQHFSDARCRWFPVFMELTNKNKHIELTPHRKFEGVKMTVGGATVIAKDIRGNIEGDISECDAFLIDGVPWPMTAIEFLRHCHQAISAVVRQLSNL